MVSVPISVEIKVSEERGADTPNIKKNIDKNIKFRGKARKIFSRASGGENSHMWILGNTGWSYYSVDNSSGCYTKAMPIRQSPASHYICKA